LREDGVVLKENNHDPNKLLKKIREIENMAGMPAFDLERPQDLKINIRVNESIGPAKFKPDPLIPNGYMANSLTIRAMRPNIFVLGDSLDDLSEEYECKCGNRFDVQFWKICPYCGSDLCS
jgi:hypothetical protein